MFPDQFKDADVEAFSLGRKKLILDIELALDPDKPGLLKRQNDLKKQILASIRPARLNGEHNDLESVRRSYRESMAALRLEGVTINQEPTTVEYLSLLRAWNQKHQPKNATK